MKKLTKISLWSIGIFIGLIFLVALIPTDPNSSDSSSDKTTQSSVNVGEEGILYIEDYDLIPVCTTKENLNELIDASIANDEIGYRDLILSDKCFMAPTLLESQTKVLVIDSSIFLQEFRFIGEESLHYGKTAWVQYEYIIPIN